MRLTENPFCLLGATTRDNRARLVELAESYGLSTDPTIANRLRSELTNPQQRLKAEVAWLPGLSPARVVEWVEKASKGTILSEEVLAGVPPLASSNLMATSLSSFLGSGATVAAAIVAFRLVSLSRMVDRIDAAETLRRINEDRTVAGFPTIGDLSDLEGALEERQREITRIVARSLRALPSDTALGALQTAVEMATNSGKEHGPPLVHELAEAYSVDLQGPLETHAKAVREEIAVLRSMLKSGLTEQEILNQTAWLEYAVKAYDRIAQPLQVSAQGRGIEHDHSRVLADEMKTLAFEMHSCRGLTRVTQRITELIREVFEELSNVAANADEILAHIKAHFAEQEQVAEAKRIWERSILYSGRYDGHEVTVSSLGVQLDSTIIFLDDVTVVRWGAISYSKGGVKTGKVYEVHLSSADLSITIACRRKDVYQGVTEALKQTVIPKLAIQLVAMLREGHAFSFGAAVVTDRSIELPSFQGQQRVRSISWGRTLSGRASGQFVIRGGTGASDFGVAISSLHCDNARVLEALVDIFRLKGGSSLSDAFTRFVNG